MRTRFPLLLALAAITSLGLSSCSEPQQSPGETIKVSDEAAASMGDVQVDTLPTDDIDEYVVDMPDGVHLQPGVDVFRIVEPAKSMLIFEEGTDQVLVPAPAVSAFDDIGERDLVFVGETAFIVKAMHKQNDMLVIDKGPVVLTDLIYGNFRIPFKLDMRKWYEANGWDYRITEETRDVVDEDGVTTHQQQIRFIDRDWPKVVFSPEGGSFEISQGHLRMNAEMNGAFEGRIGSFREEYDCTYGGAVGGRFCVDRLAVWADTTVSTKGGLKATTQANLPLFDDTDDFGGPRTVGRYPLGSTGIFVNIEFFVERAIEVKAYGKLEAEVSWDIEKSMPIGWEYTNQGQNGSGFDLLPNPGQVRTVRDNKDFDASFAAGLEASYELSTGLKFGVSDPTNTAKLRGGDVGVAVAAKANYEPLKGGIALEDDDWCFKLELAGLARMRASIEFEADFRIWSWEKNLTCPEEDACATLEKEFFKIEGTDNGDLCLELGYDELEISVADPDEPLGIEDLPGYDIDMICKERTLPANPRAGRPAPEVRTKCITENGLDSLTNQCPLQASEVLGLDRTRRFDFGEKILPGDVITVYQPRNQGCNGGGSARFRLVGGTLAEARTHEFYNYEPQEGTATLRFGN